MPCAPESIPVGFFWAGCLRPVYRPVALGWCAAEGLDPHADLMWHQWWWRCTVDIADLFCIYDVEFAGTEMRQGDDFTRVAASAQAIEDQGRRAAAVVYLALDGRLYLGDGNHRTAAAWRRGETTVEAMMIPVRVPGWRPSCS